MAAFKLESDRLIIRKLTEDDLEDFYTYRSNPVVVKYQSFDVMSRKSAENFILSQESKDFKIAGTWSQYGIEEKSTGKIIGDCAIKLDDYDQRIAEIGITMATDFQRKGFASECMLTIMKYLFDVLKIHRIVETVDADNEASIRLLEKLKFRKEGDFLENIFIKGKWESELQYAMLKSEWDKKVDRAVN